MNSNFRKLTLEKILVNAGVLTDLVKSSIEPKQTSYVNMGSAGPGTTIMAPPSPVKEDGSVDFIVNIRGISGGDTRTAARLGTNAVIITAEAGGKGSKENLQAYGNAAFINNAIERVLADLRKRHPDKNVHRGKLIISSFSGGGSAVATLLSQRNKIKGGVDGVVINDGLHISKNDPRMKDVVEFANEARKDSNKRFKLIHTAVQTSGYSSTTEVANNLLSQLGLERQPDDDYESESDVRPVAKAREGGLEIIQMYDRPDPYMVKDPKSGRLRPNIPGTAGYQHIKSLEWGNQNAFKDLGI